MMRTAIELWDVALESLVAQYETFHFGVERDIVWTLQRHLRALAGDDFIVQTDYPMVRGPRRARSADLVLLASSAEPHDGPIWPVQLAIELKYEPDHSRGDLMRWKLPVCDWASVCADVQRIHEFADTGVADAARSYLLDEGAWFRKKPPPAGAAWREFGTRGAILCAQST